jgi:hypothetical protein
LTLSGFGLGTLLVPVVAVFFPVDIAIVMTMAGESSGNIDGIEWPLDADPSSCSCYSR